MKIFSCVCRHCSYCFEILSRMPNYCPECGEVMFNSHEELLVASHNFRIHDCRNSYDAQNHHIIHDMEQ